MYNRFKELFFCASVWKAGAKVRGLFLTTKYFRSFFPKYFFQAVEATGEALIRSRSLSTAKVRYWVQRLSEGRLSLLIHQVISL